MLIANTFLPSKDTGEECIMYSKRKMGNDKETDEVMRKLTELLFSICQAGLEKTRKRRLFFFFWFCRSIVLAMSKINLKFEKQKDVDEKCFHYGVTLEENYEKLENIHKELCLL